LPSSNLDEVADLEDHSSDLRRVDVLDRLLRASGRPSASTVAR
jgi:hypothetical protein